MGWEGSIDVGGSRCPRQKENKRYSLKDGRDIFKVLSFGSDALSGPLRENEKTCTVWKSLPPGIRSSWSHRTCEKDRRGSPSPTSCQQALTSHTTDFIIRRSLENVLLLILPEA